MSWSLFPPLPKKHLALLGWGPLRSATFSSYMHDRVEKPLETTHAHTYSRNVEVRSAKWCEFQYFVSAHSQGVQLLVQESTCTVTVFFYN